MAMKKMKPKNDTIDAAGKVVVGATKSTFKGASAVADTAEKFLVASAKASADPVKFLKNFMGSKKAVSPATKKILSDLRKPIVKKNNPASQARAVKRKER
jgi:hypothetical protein